MSPKLCGLQTLEGSDAADRLAEIDRRILFLPAMICSSSHGITTSLLSLSRDPLSLDCGCKDIAAEGSLVWGRGPAPDGDLSRY